MFVRSGIPGSVGSGAINVWTELAHLVPHTRDFSVWPFEGDFPQSFASAPVVIAENYPRAAYAAALSDVTADCRARLRLSKTHEATRREVINCLASKSWVRSNDVKLNDTEAALTNENQFDALMTAAGLLRLVLEGEPLSCRALEDPAAEGGILGTGAINFNLPEADFATAQAGRPGRRLAMHDDQLARRPTGCATPGMVYRCPIPGCSKVFIGSRGGWDGYVGAFRMHPSWRPHLKDHRNRLEAFRVEYPRFFE